MRKISYRFELNAGVVAKGEMLMILHTKCLPSEDVELIRSALAQLTKALHQVERKNIVEHVGN